MFPAGKSVDMCVIMCVGGAGVCVCEFANSWASSDFVQCNRFRLL